MDAHSVYRSNFIEIDDEGYPVQPYGIKENPYSILDVADIVFCKSCKYRLIAISKDTPKQRFFWVNADVKYLAELVSTLLPRTNRWASPKSYGESYRNDKSFWSLELQEKQWMYSMV
jgi:carboxypeptidase C (cathepsin A)